MSRKCNMRSETRPKEFIKILLRLIEERKGPYLDIGCNDGYITRIVAQKAKASEVYGIDIDENLLSLSRKRGIKTILWDLNEKKELPFMDNYFGIITCLETIEHVESPDFVLKEIYRLLKINGFAIISTPRLDSIYTIISLLLGFQPDMIDNSEERMYGLMKSNAEKKCKAVGHKKLFTKLAFKEILQYHKFKILKFSQANLHVRRFPIFIRKDTQIWKVTPIKNDYESR